MGNQGTSFERTTHVEESNFQETKSELGFEKIDESDLQEAFDRLTRRCPKSWTPAYEDRASELHKKFMLLRKFKTVQ